MNTSVQPVAPTLHCPHRLRALGMHTDPVTVCDLIDKAQQKRLPYIGSQCVPGRIFHSEEALGLFTDDANIAVTGDKNVALSGCITVLSYDLPEGMKMRAVLALAKFDAAMKEYEITKRRLSRTKLRFASGHSVSVVPRRLIAIHTESHVVDHTIPCFCRALF